MLAIVLFGVSVYCSFYAENCQHLWIIGILLLLYSVAGRIQAYRHAALYGNDSNISLVYGGFKKTTIFVKATHVESVTVSASRWKAKKGIVSVTVCYLAPSAFASRTVKNVPLAAFEEVRNKLIY